MGDVINVSLTKFMSHADGPYRLAHSDLAAAKSALALTKKRITTVTSATKVDVSPHTAGLGFYTHGKLSAGKTVSGNVL